MMQMSSSDFFRLNLLLLDGFPTPPQDKWCTSNIVSGVEVLHSVL